MVFKTIVINIVNNSLIFLFKSNSKSLFTWLHLFSGFFSNLSLAFSIVKKIVTDENKRLADYAHSKTVCLITKTVNKMSLHLFVRRKLFFTQRNFSIKVKKKVFFFICIFQVLFFMGETFGREGPSQQRISSYVISDIRDCRKLHYYILFS